jgi:hypothetical protein
MKTTTIIIGALTAAVVALSVILVRTLAENKEPLAKGQVQSDSRNGNTEKSSDTTSESSSAQLDEKLRKLLCETMLIANDGEQITAQTAADEIQAFEDLYATDNVKAFHMGLSKLDEMLTKAKQYNNSQAGAQSPIIGFRFYRAISTRTLGGLQINNKFDMVIYPTLSIDQDLTTGPIYGHTRPCPRLCSE